MNFWSNIEIASNDTEITQINQLEDRLGKLPDHVRNIRALITRYEVCHFKYQLHMEKIKDAIISLKPKVDIEKIGLNHIQHGEHAWINDVTGKSLLGQQYVWAIRCWLEEAPSATFQDQYDEALGKKVHEWLGGKSEDKARLVRLLLARLTWHWKSYEALQCGGEFEALEFQLCRMDICHYAFPQNLDKVLQGIGHMKANEHFEGCGSFNKAIRRHIEKELVVLNEHFNKLHKGNKADKKSQIQSWLIACLMKTLKEQVELTEPLIDLSS